MRPVGIEPNKIMFEDPKIKQAKLYPNNLKLVGKTNIFPSTDWN